MIEVEQTLLAAHRLERMMTVGLALVALFTLGGLVVGVSAPLDVARTIARHVGYGDAPLLHWQAWVLIGVVSAHLAFWFALLAVARDLFGKLAQGHPGAAARSARRLAALLWAMLVCGLMAQALASVAATWGFPVGQRSLSIALGTPQISVAISALVASFMAHAFALGAELWQDHREVI